ncbi:MAG TPA: type II toxin-antitoxin system VapC family toxin [Stellaceae bacterium]|nr:type II toxin-antitoxin system VapC family toxin [Stellaceae bacterium]
MTIFADASALIAIIAGEPDADALADLLEAEQPRLCSAISTWETIAGLCRSYHPASLNMGDCYAYACAKANRAKLLFKGEDFTKTDITPAGSCREEDETGN